MGFFFVCFFTHSICSGSYFLIGTTLPDWYIPLNPDFLFRVLSYGFGAFFFVKAMDEIWKPEVENCMYMHVIVVFLLYFSRQCSEWPGVSRS